MKVARTSERVPGELIPDEREGMSTTTVEPKKARKPAHKEHREHYRLGVNSYDRASSLLVSLLVMAGTVFFALVIIFFARQFVSMPVPVPVIPLAPGDLPEDRPMGVAEDIEPPGVEDAPELTEPSLMDTLNALTSTVSSKQAILSDQALDASDKVGRGSGLGDKRQPGGGGDGLPSREIQFEVANLDAYAKLLDFFKIEIGVISTTDTTAHYATQLSRAKPAVRTGPRGGEKRYYFQPRGVFANFDRQLASKAGIAGKGQLIYHFYPQESYMMLLGIEQQHARQAGKKPADIELTAFQIKPKGSGFEFVVDEQLYY